SCGRLNQVQFATEHTSQTDEASSQQAQSTGLGHRNGRVAAIQTSCTVEVAFVRIHGERNLRGPALARRPVSKVTRNGSDQVVLVIPVGKGNHLPRGAGESATEDRARRNAV